MKWSNEKVLVTGGAGFIGSHLARRLLDEEADVIVLDNFSEGRKDNVPDGCNIIKGDIRDRKALNGVGSVDYVFNFGSPSSIILFNTAPVTCVDITICGFLNVLEWARDVEVKMVVYPTSGSVYGNTPVPQSEEDQVLPMNLYGISKLACEHIARLYCKQLKIVGLRIFAGYGPGEEHKGDFASPVTIFLNSMTKNERPVVYGNGTQSRDFVYIDDVVDAIIRAAERNVAGTINVGSGKSYSFNEVIDCINQCLGRNIKPVYVDKPINYLEKTLADTTKMKKMLRTNPLDLKEGLRKYLHAMGQSSSLKE